MSAYVECRVCGRQRDEDDRLSNAEIETLVKAAGWSILPTRCPDHVGVTPPPTCEDDHDPEPWVQNAGIAVGGGSGITFGGSRRSRFKPREGFCRIMLHYIENAAEYRAGELVPA